MTPVGLEPTISAGERRQTYALDGATTGTGLFILESNIYQFPSMGFQNTVFRVHTAVAGVSGIITWRATDWTSHFVNRNSREVHLETSFS
jgi:hypothetical protein